MYTDAVPVYTDADATPAPAPAPTVAFVAKKGMRDDPSAPWFVSTKNDDTDATAGGERVKTDRRAAHKNPVVYDMLSETVLVSLPKRFSPIGYPFRAYPSNPFPETSKHLDRPRGIRARETRYEFQYDRG